MDRTEEGVHRKMLGEHTESRWALDDHMRTSEVHSLTVEENNLTVYRNWIRIDCLGCHTDSDSSHFDFGSGSSSGRDYSCSDSIDPLHN